MGLASSFQPSGRQIKAAESLFVAIAMEETMRPIVEGYQKSILARHKFHKDVKWSERVGDDEVIVDPKISYLLNDEDAAVYHAECNATRDSLGLKTEKPGNCPLLEAEYARLRCESALLTAMGDTKEFEALARANLSGAKRVEAVSLALKILAPHCKESAKEMVDAVLADKKSALTADDKPGVEPVAPKHEPQADDNHDMEP